MSWSFCYLKISLLLLNKEMRGIHIDPKNEFMLARYKRVVSTFHRVLTREKLFTPHEFRVQCWDSTFIVVPRFSSRREVYAFDREVERVRAEKKRFGETLYKIPVHVNDIESYMEMLLYKRYGWKLSE